ncbi:hypothetical protein FRC00_005579 [Tulasnella sp. 408]|nr:hypothetical protein FRC00_005579 [Tulasnella sp. 408]
MTLSGRWARRFSPKEDQPSPSSPVSNSTWARIKAKISRRRHRKATDPEITRGANVPTNDPPLLLTPHTESSSSSLHDSPVSDLISKCDYACSSVPRADALGAIGPTECYVPLFDAEANAGEAVKAVSLQHFPSVPSPDPFRFIERFEQSPSRELASPWTPESLYALSRLESDEFRACLKEAGIVKARRRGLRVQALRAHRASFEPANEEVPPETNALGLITSPEHDGLTVDKDSAQSAGQEDSSSAAAPVATPHLNSTPYEWVIKAITPCTQSAAEESLGMEWIQSAGDDESKSSLPAAPTPSTAVLRFEPCKIVIVVTPPTSPPTSPPTTRLALSPVYARSLGTDPDDSQPVSHHPEVANATPEGDTPCVAFQEPAIPENRPPVKNYSRPFRPPTDEGVGSAASVRPSERTDSELFMSLTQGETEAQNAHAKKETLSASNPSGLSGETEDQLTFLDMLALGGSIDDADQSVDGEENASAADEAEPSIGVEPVSPLSSRKPALTISSPSEPLVETEEQLSFFDMLALGGTNDDADQTVDGVDDQSAVDEADPSFSVEPVPALMSRWSATVTQSSEEPMPRPVQYRLRALTSRVSSSLRKWGKAVSRSFVRCPEGNTPSGPSFDARQGFVPSRGPLLDCIRFSDALALPKSNVWNISITG